jgi:hypothetical protein
VTAMLDDYYINAMEPSDMESKFNNKKKIILYKDTIYEGQFNYINTVNWGTGILFKILQIEKMLKTKNVSIFCRDSTITGTDKTKNKNILFKLPDEHISYTMADYIHDKFSVDFVKHTVHTNNQSYEDTIISMHGYIGTKKITLTFSYEDTPIINEEYKTVDNNTELVEIIIKKKSLVYSN